MERGKHCRQGWIRRHQTCLRGCPSTRMSKPERESCCLTFLMSMLGPAMGHAVPHDHVDMWKHDRRALPGVSPLQGSPSCVLTGRQGLRLLFIIPEEETEDNSAFMLHRRRTTPPN